jgi:hypothetical protein
MNSSRDKTRAIRTELPGVTTKCKVFFHIHCYVCIFACLCNASNVYIFLLLFSTTATRARPIQHIYLRSVPWIIYLMCTLPISVISICQIRARFEPGPSVTCVNAASLAILRPSGALQGPYYTGVENAAFLRPRF